MLMKFVIVLCRAGYANLTALLALPALFAIFATPAAASVIYSYTGSAYASCSGAYAIAGTTTCNGTYSITSSFTLNTALAPDLTGVFLPGNVGQTDSGYTLLGLAATDHGAITLAGSFASFGALVVWTNASGTIDNWAYDIFADHSAPSGICAMQFCDIRSINVPSDLGPGGQYCIITSSTAPADCVLDTSSYSDPASGKNSNMPGTWTETVLGAVPEPSALSLFAAGLIAIWLQRRLRRRAPVNLSGGGPVHYGPCSARTAAAVSASPLSSAT